MHVKNLEIGYQTAITKPMSIEVSKGDHIAIIGPNGIGKSTLIKTIANQQKRLMAILLSAQIYKLVIMIKSKQNLNLVKRF
ncbi:ABC transporter ATP-binding protein [Staphylococcus aureus]|uniref:ABC transporter ATP-binding protein n=1 Tax=Staphylococcus aureus TaxID=1280 RepID=A0A380EKC0_STAAU|nr:ABC transporter ATP-binding protein [Staphylococcus aureus]